jgi:hypothetical protein
MTLAADWLGGATMQLSQWGALLGDIGQGSRHGPCGREVALRPELGQNVAPLRYVLYISPRAGYPFSMRPARRCGA